MFNGPVHVLAKTIKAVMASAMEAGMKALFVSAQALAELRQALGGMGHPQPPTPLCTGSNTAHGIINGIFEQGRSKAIDMRFHWLKDRAEQGQFKICWAPGEENWADHFTKHHPASHHKTVRPVCLNEEDSPSDLQGCLELLKSVLGKKSKDCLELNPVGSPIQACG